MALVKAREMERVQHSAMEPFETEEIDRTLEWMWHSGRRSGEGRLCVLRRADGVYVNDAVRRVAKRVCRRLPTAKIEDANLASIEKLASEKRHPIDQFKRIIAGRTRDPGVKLVDGHLSELHSLARPNFRFAPHAISVRSPDTKTRRRASSSLRILTRFADGFQRAAPPSVQCWHRSDASNFQTRESGRLRKRGFGSLGLDAATSRSTIGRFWRNADVRGSARSANRPT
jgi:hypothetical protein